MIKILNIFFTELWALYLSNYLIKQVHLDNIPFKYVWLDIAWLINDLYNQWDALSMEFVIVKNIDDLFFYLKMRYVELNYTNNPIL